VFLKCLKETSTLSSLTESEDEQHLLLHHGCRHTKCSCIPLSVHATASRNRRNEKQKRPFLERISHVANTASKQFAHVLQEGYSPVKVDDVAFLLLDQLLEGVAPVILGSALHNEDHRSRPACRAAQDDRRGSQLGCQREMRTARSSLYPGFRG